MKDSRHRFTEDCKYLYNISIPDANFRAKLLANTTINSDEDKTGISFVEAAAYTGSIDVSGSQITSLINAVRRRPAESFLTV